jgi:hypothetical protein
LNSAGEPMAHASARTSGWVIWLRRLGSKGELDFFFDADYADFAD